MKQDKYRQDDPAPVMCKTDTVERNDETGKSNVSGKLGELYNPCDDTDRGRDEKPEVDTVHHHCTCVHMGQSYEAFA